MCCLCHLGEDFDRPSYLDTCLPQVADTAASRESWSNGLPAGVEEQDVHEALRLLWNACQNVDEEQFKTMCSGTPEMWKEYHRIT